MHLCFYAQFKFVSSKYLPCFCQNCFSLYILHAIYINIYIYMCIYRDILPKEPNFCCKQTAKEKKLRTFSYFTNLPCRTASSEKHLDNLHHLKHFASAKRLCLMRWNCIETMRIRARCTGILHSQHRFAPRLCGGQRKKICCFKK